LYDYGHAAFADSAGARNVVNGINPMTPGGLSPKNTSVPTLVWAVGFAVVAFWVFSAWKKGK